MLNLIQDPAFWIGVGIGGTGMAALFFGFVIAIGVADEREEVRNPAAAADRTADQAADLRDEEAFLRGQALSTATTARQDRSDARRWPKHVDVDGFAQPQGRWS